MSYLVTRGLGGYNLVVRGLGTDVVLVYIGSDDPFALTTVADLWAQAHAGTADLSEFVGWEVTTRAVFAERTGIDLAEGLSKVTRDTLASTLTTDDLTTVTIH